MMPEYRKVLVATDLTPNAAQALRHAAAIAHCQGAELYLLHVLPTVDPAVLNYVSTVMGEERLTDFELAHKDDIRQDIQKRLESVVREEMADHPETLARIAGIEVHHGHPVPVILETADRLEADLVVLGSHGKGRLKYAVLGSVAEKVLRRSPRPVLVVPLG